MNTKRKLIEGLSRVGGRFDRIAARIHYCRQPVMGAGPGGTVQLRRMGACNFRLCPETRRRIQSKVWASYGKALMEMETPKHLSLTVENVSILTMEDVRHFKDAVTEVLKFLRTKRGCRGGLYSFEAKHGSTGWHFHVHAIVDVGFIPRKMLRMAWLFESGAKNNFLKRAWWSKGNPNPDAARGLVNYIFKETFEFDYASPVLVEQFLDATYDLNLYGSFGSVRAGRVKMGKVASANDAEDSSLPKLPGKFQARDDEFDDLLDRIKPGWNSRDAGPDAPET
jgi:hypothetical protein